MKRYREPVSPALIRGKRRGRQVSWCSPLGAHSRRVGKNAWNFPGLAPGSTTFFGARGCCGRWSVQRPRHTKSTCGAPSAEAKSDAAVVIVGGAREVSVETYSLRGQRRNVGRVLSARDSCASVRTRATRDAVEKDRPQDGRAPSVRQKPDRPGIAISAALSRANPHRPGKRPSRPNLDVITRATVVAALAVQGRAAPSYLAAAMRISQTAVTPSAILMELSGFPGCRKRSSSRKAFPSSSANATHAAAGSTSPAPVLSSATSSAAWGCCNDESRATSSTDSVKKGWVANAPSRRNSEPSIFVGTESRPEPAVSTPPALGGRNEKGICRTAEGFAAPVTAGAVPSRWDRFDSRSQRASLASTSDSIQPSRIWLSSLRRFEALLRRESSKLSRAA